jgi:hypothetical protein
VLERLDAAVIDTVLGGPRAGGGVSTGTYLTLAALNRVCDPRSKAGFAAWWATVDRFGVRIDTSNALA